MADAPFFAKAYILNIFLTMSRAKKSHRTSINVPVVGRIAAGQPIEAIEDRSTVIAVGRDLLRGRVGICFKFPRNNRDTRRVELVRPNRVGLDETDRDRYLESVLMRWEFIDHAAKTRLWRAGQGVPES